MEVSNHVILFLDILGYKELISNSNNDKSENDYLIEIHGLMKNLSEYIEKRNKRIDENFKYDLNLSRFKYLIFSDNILFFAPYYTDNDMQNLYGNLMYGLSAFLFQYNKSDIFFRGAITKGLLYYDEKLHFVFGSGLIRAYELESNIAIYPRIVIDDCLCPSPILVGWEKDHKNIWYLDYMLLGYSILCNDQLYSLSIKWHVYDCIEEHQKAIIKAMDKYSDNEKILEKYIWLAGYHNTFCKRKRLTELLIDCK